jgi:hypothetical protein
MANLLKIILTKPKISNLVNYQRKRFAYRNGIVASDEHPILLKGQVVEIMEEQEEDYIVRVFLTGQPLKVEKKHILIN